jgi:hypothetical protein
MSVASNKIADFHPIGNANPAIGELLRGMPLASASPDGAEIFFIRRGTMRCQSGAPQCELALLTPLQATTKSRDEERLASVPSGDPEAPQP